MSTMQTARVTEKGKFDYLVGGGFANIKTSENPDYYSSGIPIVELGVRYGITDRLDAGLKISTCSLVTLDSKYQFLGDKNSKLAGSVGLGGSYSYLGIGTEKINAYNAMLPIYFSYHPVNWLTLYCSPKYVLQITNNDYINSNQIFSTVSHWYGATGGIRIGKRIAFLAEYSLFGNNIIPILLPYSQITCGVAFFFFK